MSETLYLILPIVVFIGLIILLRIIFPSKGKVGEKRVSHKLDKLPEDKYRVLNNVILPTQSGTNQIDHIVVSVYGIFVIETKFYSGWIFGGENSEYWTQNIYGNKYQLYNPVLQNGGHVRTLLRLLKEYGDLPIFPIVAFSPQADLHINTTNACVVYWNQLYATIRRYSRERLSMEQVRAICRAIESSRLSSEEKENMKLHNENVHKTVFKKEESLSSGRCPRCGGKLVLRDGKYGKFYGCSNYPRCRFTQQC